MNWIQPDNITAGITVIGSIFVVCITYYKTKQLKFFEAFFDKKTKAYELFFKAALGDFQICFKENNGLDYAISVALLYCPEKGKETLKEFNNLLIQIENIGRSNEVITEEFSEELICSYHKQKNAVLDILREDIQNCRKFKFN